jgi:4-amino-4-deoxy-L-arabinose transferase-like glycosyltransferase
MLKPEIKTYGLDIFVPSFMTDLIGFFFIGLVILITFAVSFKWPNISKIIFTALTLRILVILIGHYLLYLPDTKADALGYEWGAWNLSQDGFINVLKNFNTFKYSFFYSWIMAIPYSLFGRNILILQSIGLFFGVGSVFLGWLLAKKLWDENTAHKVGWILALFPSLILYSVITLKEVYCSFFLLLAMVGVVNWTKTKNFSSAFLAIVGFFVAGFFHGPLFLGGILFSIIFCVSILINSFKLFLSLRISLKNSIVIFLILIFLFAFFTNKIYLPYLGTFDVATDIYSILDAVSNRLRGNASYPEWLIIATPSEFVNKGFLRMIYFLFYPFPWVIKEPIHLLGALDSFLYFVLIFLIILNFKTILKDPALRIILLILVFYLFIYGIGVSNFGAAIRHRSKFIIEIVLLAGPLIPRFIFSKKKIMKRSWKIFK